MNVFDKWARDTILESIFIILSPVFPFRPILWEVMDAVSGRLAHDIGNGARVTYVEKYARSSSWVETLEVRRVT